MVLTQPLDEQSLHQKAYCLLQISGLCCQSLYWILLWCLLSPWMNKVFIKKPTVSYRSLGYAASPYTGYSYGAYSALG